MAHAKARNDVRQFYFPCPNCGCGTFHSIVEEAGGITVGIPFFRPLLASQRANSAVCLECHTVNARLSGDDVKKLADGCMPKTIYGVHSEVAGFYSLETLKLFEQQFADSPDELAKWKTAHGWYRLEL